MFESFINSITQAAGGSDAITGALILSLVVMLRDVASTVPKAIANFVRLQCTTTMTFNNTSYEKRHIFCKLSEFVQKLSTQVGSRTLSIDSYWSGGGERHTVLTMGFGRHYFFYKGKLLYLNRTALESSGGDLLKEQISMTAFTRSHAIFHTLLAENTPKDESHLLSVNTWSTEGWQMTNRVNCGGLDSLALNPETVAMFRKEMEHFLNNEGEFRKLGLPYKLTMILHGIPGSGKTSIIRSLAKEYGLSVSILNISQMSDTSLPAALQSLPSKTIVAMEDFDSATATKARTNVASVDGKGDKSSPDGLADIYAGLSLTTILNALDGICSLDGSVIMMTTNCISNVDAAILRSGRVDGKIELPKLAADTVRGHFVERYPTLVNYNEWPELSGSEVNRIKMVAKADANIAAHELLHMYTASLKMSPCEDLELDSVQKNDNGLVANFITTLNTSDVNDNLVAIPIVPELPTEPTYQVSKENY